MTDVISGPDTQEKLQIPGAEEENRMGEGEDKCVLISPLPFMKEWDTMDMI